MQEISIGCLQGGKVYVAYIVAKVGATVSQLIHNKLTSGMTTTGCGVGPAAFAAAEDATLPRHWMRDFYLADLCLESQENSESLGRLQAGCVSACLV